MFLIIGSLNKNGRAYLIVPDSLLFSDSIQHVETRKYLLENLCVNKIIQIDEQFYFNKGIKNSILFFENKNKTTKVDFSKISICGEEVEETYLNSFDIDKIKNNLYSLYYKNYQTDLSNKSIEFKYVSDLFNFSNDKINNTNYIGLSKYYKNIKVIEALPTILPMFNETTIKMVKEELEKCNIKLLLNNKVKRIGPTIIETDQSTHFYEIAIWTCGIKPNSLIKKLTSDRFSVDSNLKFKDSIYAMGDIIASKDHGPPTAQNAKQQGEYLARFFNNDFVGPDYKYIERGKIIHTKDWIIIETRYGSFRVPYLFEPLINQIVTKL
jgi:hypothetical protein